MARNRVPLESETSLGLLTNGELNLMQNIMLSQIQNVAQETELLLLGRVWYRLEGERRRRKSEVMELERLYFAS
jgi:hypothetical protein